MSQFALANILGVPSVLVYKPCGTCRRFLQHVLSCVVAVTFLFSAATATEHGASVYPVGIETVFPGLTPAAGGTMLYGYTAYYTANELDGSNGKSLVPGFRLDVFGAAFKVVHNWNVHILGGMLNSNVAVPFLHEHVNLPTGKSSKFSLANVSLGVFEVGYNRGDWHWLYEADVFLPGGSYTKTDPLNVGQHNFGFAPVGALTYLPFHGKTELSSKFQYIVNFHNPATQYHSGNEFTWEYDAMQEVSKRLALGVNGFFYQQTTDDKQSGATVGDGFRGRDLGIGPELRVRLGPHSGLAIKYQRDTLVQNKPRGGAIWFQLGIPLSTGKSIGH